MDIVDVAEVGDIAAVRELVDADPTLVSAKVPEGDNPLHIACWQKHVEVAEFLIARGADVNALGDSNKTPLHYAVYEGDLEERTYPLVRALTAAGADVNAKDRVGYTVLDYAWREFLDLRHPVIVHLEELGACVTPRGVILSQEPETVREYLKAEGHELDPGMMRRLRDEVAGLGVPRDVLEVLDEWLGQEL